MLLSVGIDVDSESQISPSADVDVDSDPQIFPSAGIGIDSDSDFVELHLFLDDPVHGAHYCYQNHHRKHLRNHHRNRQNHHL